MTTVCKSFIKRLSVVLPFLNVGHKMPRGAELSKCQLHPSLTQAHTYTSFSFSHPPIAQAPKPIIHSCTHTHISNCSYLYSCDRSEPPLSASRWHINCMNIHVVVRVASSATQIQSGSVQTMHNYLALLTDASLFCPFRFLFSIVLLS